MHNVPGNNLLLRGLLLQPKKRTKRERVKNRRRKSLWIASTCLLCWYLLPISKTKAHIEGLRLERNKTEGLLRTFAKLTSWMASDDAVFRRRSIELVILIVTYLIFVLKVWSITKQWMNLKISRQLSILLTKPFIFSWVYCRFISSHFHLHVRARALSREIAWQSPLEACALYIVFSLYTWPSGTRPACVLGSANSRKALTGGFKVTLFFSLLKNYPNDWLSSWLPEL